MWSFSFEKGLEYTLRLSLDEKTPSPSTLWTVVMISFCCCLSQIVHPCSLKAKWIAFVKECMRLFGKIRLLEPKLPVGCLKQEDHLLLVQWQAKVTYNSDAGIVARCLHIMWPMLPNLEFHLFQETAPCTSVISATTRNASTLSIFTSRMTCTTEVETCVHTESLVPIAISQCLFVNMNLHVLLIPPTTCKLRSFLYVEHPQVTFPW